MRDPKRIKKILNLIEEIWIKYPDWRLTQLVMNSLNTNIDPYYVDDEDLEECLNNLKVELKL